MPLQYVNPARRSRRKGRRALPLSTRRMPLALRKYWNAKKRSAKKNGPSPHYMSKRKRAHGRGQFRWRGKYRLSTGSSMFKKTSLGAAKNPRRRRKPTKRKTRKTMARRKLYGAAAAAHAKKHGRKRRRRGKRRHAARRRGRRVGGSKRSRAARKAARTRAANKAMRRAAARKGARRRRRRHGGIKVVRRRRRRHTSAALMLNPRRRRRRRRRNPARRHRRRGRRMRANPHRRRRRYHRRRRNPRRSTQYSLRRARRAIRNRYKTSLGSAYARRHRMRSNPGFVGGAMDVVKMALPIAISIYGARALSKQLPSLPGFNMIPAGFQGIAAAGGTVVAAHFLTNLSMLRKYKGAAMTGAGINLIDSVLSAFAPASIKSMFGVGDIYDNGLSDYVTMGEYMSMGSPIDDDITLNDYVEVGALQEELGVEEELGLEEELGSSLDRAYLGGTSSESMLRTVGQTSMIGAVPQRSFTRDVRRAGSGYDKANVLYGGIFGGGF